MNPGFNYCDLSPLLTELFLYPQMIRYVPCFLTLNPMFCGLAEPPALQLAHALVSFIAVHCGDSYVYISCFRYSK